METGKKRVFKKIPGTWNPGCRDFKSGKNPQNDFNSEKKFNKDVSQKIKTKEMLTRCWRAAENIFDCIG